MVDKVRELNRRTLDSLSAKAYFYFSLFHEELDPKPPSKQSPVISIRGKLLAALRSAVLRKDQDTQASVTTLLLRNYISTADITQADLLVAQTQFPATAPPPPPLRILSTSSVPKTAATAVFLRGALTALAPPPVMLVLAPPLMLNVVLRLLELDAGSCAFGAEGGWGTEKRARS